jgi:hypothetical protein
VRVLLTLAMALGVLIAATPDAASASASHPRAIKAHCGAHLGKLIRRNQGGSIYHVRLGVKRHGGTHMCHGYWASTAHKLGGGLTIDWHPFTLPDWSWSGAANVTRDTLITTGMCAAASAGFAAEFPTASSSTLITLAAGAGCVDGVVKLGFRFHNSVYPVRR